jgi:hypothetical protein
MDKNKSKQFVYFGLIIFVFAIYTIQLASLQLGKVPYKNMAINNALNKIYDLDPMLPACKVGLESRASDLKVPNYENFYESGC